MLSWLVGAYFSPYLKLPPSLLGLLLMLLALLIIKRVPLALLTVSDWALRSMVLLFIPVTVGATAYIADLGLWVWLLLLAILFSTVLSMVITAWLAQKLLAANSKSPADE